MCNFIQTSMMALWTTSCLLLLAAAGVLGTPTIDDASVATEHAGTLDRLATIEATLASVLQKNAEQDRIVQDVLLKNVELEERVEVLEVENEWLKETVAVLKDAGKQPYEHGPDDIDAVKRSGCIGQEKVAVDDNNKDDGQGQGQGQGQGIVAEGQQEADDDTSLKANIGNRQANVLSIASSGIPAVAFTASLDTFNVSHLGRGQHIPYDHVITNVGNAYNFHSGVFIAPMTGVYGFNFDTMVEGGDREYLELVLDGVSVINAYAQATFLSKYMFVTTSRTAVLQVNQGSEVWIRTGDSPEHGSGTVHGNHYTSFSGWLLAVTH